MTSLWLPSLASQQPNAEVNLRLFCFPYAGGSSVIFRSWSNHLPPQIQVCPIELPGRGARFLEPPFRRIDPLARAIVEAMLPYLDIPFALFGHSMGSLVSYEVAQLLQQEHHLSPAHLFVSAYRAPQVPLTQSPIHTLSENDFVEKIRSLNGTPKVILENTELMQLVMPILRADFEVIETHIYKNDPPLSCPITALGGIQDEEWDEKALLAWQAQTNRSFFCQMLPGDHFFVQSAQPLVLSILVQQLQCKINSAISSI